jgi:hypothetical protein
MTGDRHLDWEGCWNVRDLGGLHGAAGRLVRRGAVVRADALDRLTAAGWAALQAHGIRTVVDLRNDDERAPDAAPRPGSLTTVHLPLDGIEDRAFWDEWSSGPQFGTPLYYGPHLRRFPQRTAAVVSAVARAAPGGVAVHCGIGRDRTGLISMVLLALAGVAPEDIADDHALSTRRLPALFAARGEEDHGPAVEAYLAGRGTTAGRVIVSTLAALDVEAVLREGGLGDDELAALRHRLLGDAASI